VNQRDLLEPGPTAAGLPTVQDSQHATERAGESRSASLDLPTSVTTAPQPGQHATERQAPGQSGASQSAAAVEAIGSSAGHRAAVRQARSQSAASRSSADAEAAAPREAERASVVERLWTALREIEDPEIPVSLVDMGLIVSIEYLATDKTARLQITYTAMGCPAMDMIQDDIRARLLQEINVENVEIEVVWDPVWTHRQLSPAARASMRELGIAV
jgi:metal-sulfur cluster biosynthetic enzyme